MNKATKTAVMVPIETSGNEMVIELMKAINTYRLIKEVNKGEIILAQVESILER